MTDPLIGYRDHLILRHKTSFSWVHFKTIVFASPPINLQRLKHKIRVVCNQLTDEQITALTNKDFMRRAESRFVHGGQQC